MKRILVLMIACMFACNERAQNDEEDCYPLNPDPGATLGPYPLVCGRPWGYLPETPAGLEDEEGPYHVALCIPAESSSECAMCPTDEVNDRIVEHIVEVMEDEGDRCAPARVAHIVPECVTTPEQGSNTGCCFNAWYWGSCNIKG